MEIDIGSTVDGTIVKIAEYGAIVRLQGGKTGLVHISEISDTFVRDVKDFFKENDRVRVKVLSLTSKGRYELSTKNVEQPPERISAKTKPVPKREPEPVYLGPEIQSYTSDLPNRPSFDEQMSRFLKDSQERLLDVKRNVDSKQGVRRKSG